jgi:citrate lyase beta subunit
MDTTIPSGFLAPLFARLDQASRDTAPHYPGDSGGRRPVHVVYGGAHLFRAGIAGKLGNLALRSLDEFAPDAATFAEAFGIEDPDLAAAVRDRVARKLKNEAVEDFRIDFEDGYGIRPGAEEDGHAVAAAAEVVAGLSASSLPPFIGIRIKPLAAATRDRAVRTLDLFVTALGGRIPPQFRVTLPKITVPEEPAALAGLCDELERRTGLEAGALKIEIQVETPAAYLNARGEVPLLALAEAAGGRCVAAHFGVYDFTTALGITGSSQNLLHPACDFARLMMQLAYAGTGVAVADSITNVFPIPRSPGDRETVHRAWRLHYQHVRHALDLGFYSGWDLHPAQLPARYAALYAFFLEGLDAAAGRLRNFIGKAAQATRVGEVFDDAATGHGLLNYFLRAVDCGAVTEGEAAEKTGLTREQLRGGSFAFISHAGPDRATSLFPPR